MTTMLLDALLATLHHLAVFGLVAMLIAELVLLDCVPTGQRLRLLARLDATYGALALVVIVAGALRLIFGAKGWAFYVHNPFFWMKLGAFGLVGVLSVRPTRTVLRWRRQSTLPDAMAVHALRPWLLAQLGLLALMPLLAALMARGLGH